jgi:hypothetical protein
MRKRIAGAAMLSVLLAAAGTAALAETTVLRGTLPRDTNPAPQTDNTVNTNNAVNASGGRTPDIQSGTTNAVRTGSANAGGEIANPPPGLVPGSNQNPNRP